MPPFRKHSRIQQLLQTLRKIDCRHLSLRSAKPHRARHAIADFSNITIQIPDLCSSCRLCNCRMSSIDVDLAPSSVLKLISSLLYHQKLLLLISTERSGVGLRPRRLKPDCCRVHYRQRLQARPVRLQPAAALYLLQRRRL